MSLLEAAFFKMAIECSCLHTSRRMNGRPQTDAGYNDVISATLNHAFTLLSLVLIVVHFATQMILSSSVSLFIGAAWSDASTVFN
jgi:preprotein translocase subunit SecF